MKNLPNYWAEERPWGNFERYTLNEPSTVKIIKIKAGEAFSLQYHQLRDEYWRVMGGSGTVRVGDTESEAKMDDTFFIPRHAKHRAAGGPNGLTLLEIAFGQAEENDIVRLEDKYGRIK